MSKFPMAMTSGLELTPPSGLDAAGVPSKYILDVSTLSPGNLLHRSLNHFPPVISNKWRLPSELKTVAPSVNLRAIAMHGMRACYVDFS
jgi:hypothetical protein